jgi:hypothetical protein
MGSSFSDSKIVYQLDSATGGQVAKNMSLQFTCPLEGSTSEKLTEVGYYPEAIISKAKNSYLEVREVTASENPFSGLKQNVLRVVDNLSLSNLNIIALLVSKETHLAGSQVTFKTLPQIGSVFLEFNRETGMGLFTLLGANGTAQNMTCKSIRILSSSLDTDVTCVHIFQ